jgi:hypothetical protein
MKYIITNKQYRILKEQTEQVLNLPSVDYFGGSLDANVKD